jgi:CDP-6-deoxy-D-xylo-4-hexulose-3-dehydrase
MIPLMKDTFMHEYEIEQALAEFILKTPHLSMNSKCFEFEKAFSEYQSSRYALLFNSGGSANLAILQALKNIGKLKEGDKIGFSGLTWSTNVMPIIQMKMEPVPIDCNFKTLNIMSGNLNERLRSEKLKALFITNALGFAGDLDKIKKICTDNEILFFEDNCEALGTELFSGKTGSFGFASSFSFFVAHHISTIEGGMVCTNDEEFADMLKIVRANGWDRNMTSEKQLKWRRKHNIKSEFEAKYTFYDLGFNMRPTEITGFLGSCQLRFLEENIAKRNSNYLRFESFISKNPDLICFDRAHIKRLSPFATPVLCKTPELKDKYLSQFAGAGVEVRPMIAGNILKQPFFKKYVALKYELPSTDFIHDCGFYCGNYPELTETDIEVITSCLRAY